MAISEFCETKTDDISLEKSSFQGIGGGDVSRETIQGVYSLVK